MAKKNGKKKVGKKKAAKRKAVKRKAVKKAPRKSKGRFGLPEFRNAPTNLNFITSFLKQAELLTEISHLTVKDLTSLWETALRSGYDLSPLALIIEVTTDQQLNLYVINCSRREITLFASMLEVDPFELEYHDTVQNVASKEIILRFRGEVRTLFPMGHKELPNAIALKLDDLCDPGLLREGAMQVKVEYTMDGKKHIQPAIVSCAPREKQTL